MTSRLIFLLRSTKWNASLILTCGFQELGALPKVLYMLQNPHSCKDSKMAPPLDFLQGHVTASKLVPRLRN